METLLRELDAARQAAATAKKKVDEIQSRHRVRQRPICSSSMRRPPVPVLLTACLRRTGTLAVGTPVHPRWAKRLRSNISPLPLGYADYVVWDDNGNPLAVTEAKKTAVDSARGRQQAKLYADDLEKMHGQRPVIFYTNGCDIWMWDGALG